MRELLESRGFSRKAALGRALDQLEDLPAAPGVGADTTEVGGVAYKKPAVDSEILPAAGEHAVDPVDPQEEQMLDILGDTEDTEVDTAPQKRAPATVLEPGDPQEADTIPGLTDAPPDAREDTATAALWGSDIEDVNEDEKNETADDSARQLALPVVGSVDEMRYPYDEASAELAGAFSDFAEYWPFDGVEITDLPELIRFSRPSEVPGDAAPAPQQLQLGLLRCMGYDGGDEIRVQIEIENENNRRARIDVAQLDPTNRQADGDINLNQPGYEGIWALLAQFEDQSVEGMRHIKKTHIHTLLYKHERTINGRRYMWSIANEIVLRDTVSQLCFAMKFTKDKREIPWAPFKGKEYTDETLGAVQWTDSVKVVKDKRDKTVFADRASRIGTIRALSKNMAAEALTDRDEHAPEKRNYKLHYFEMCYQGALEEMIKRFNRLPEETRERLGRGGGKTSDIYRNKEQIQQEIKAANCTEYELIGLMKQQ